MKSYRETSSGREDRIVRTEFNQKRLERIAKQLEKCFYVVDGRGKKIRRAY